MNILITGGCGFIGSYLAEYHITQGDCVWIVDDLSTGSIENVRSFQGDAKLRVDTADLLTWNKLEEAVIWSNRIYHMAAIVGNFRVIAEPAQVIASNIACCQRLFSTIPKTGIKPQVVMASSSGVYGHSRKDFMNEEDNLVIESPKNQHSNYAISKLSDEAIAFAAFSTEHVPLTIIRPFNVIGPRQTGRYGFVVPRFIQQAIQNQPITVFGAGTQTRCFCDIRDFVAATVRLSENPNSVGQIVNIGQDRVITIQALAELIKECAHSQSEIHNISYQEAYGVDYADIMQRRPDLSKLYALTQYTWKWTLEETINDLVSGCVKSVRRSLGNT